MNKAVIVRPVGEDPDARVAISYGCIKNKIPPLMLFKKKYQSTGTLVHKLTKGAKEEIMV